MTDRTRFIHEWCEFGDFRAYILMIIARRKFNEDLTHNSEIVHRRVITTKQDIGRCYRDLLALTDRYDNHFRLYLTVNARDTLDGYFNFRVDMDKWIRDHTYGDENAEPKFARVGSRWKSALHRPESKADSYFLFDLDDVKDVEFGRFCSELENQTDIQTTRQTPNGYHVICDPFNYTEWEPPVAYDDLDTDGQVFIEEIEP